MRTFLVFGALGLFFYLSFVPPSGVSPMESIFRGWDEEIQKLKGTGASLSSATGMEVSSSSSL